MRNKGERIIPLITSVGQVVIFPYYIIWLKEVSYNYTLFAWLFAIFSFAAALGYQIFQKNRINERLSISFIYIITGIVYSLVGLLKLSLELLPYAALLVQIVLGFLQGYFRAWHVQQKSYRLHAINHYLIVGMMMIALSFVKIISPLALLASFGIVMCFCGVWEFAAIVSNDRLKNK